MEPALVFVLFAFVVAIILVWSVRYARKAGENFARLAVQFGLTPDQPRKILGIVWSQPTATGEIRGRPARLFSYSTGSGKSRTNWCALSIDPRQHGGLTFEISLQGLGSKLKELFGTKEIVVGETAFDAKWFIQTNQPQFMEAALIPELRERLTTSLADAGRIRRPTLKLDSGTLRYSEVGSFGNEVCCQRISGLKEVMSDFADVAEVFALHSLSQN
ncbi:MAG TPA: hypothetical protein VL069_15775 [Opitutus sp.]|nr:hypothetical protein [Opitutus sp.]